MSINGFYTELAPFYRDYSLKKQPYLKSIDEIILSNLQGKSMLDVGSADGVRVRKIADKAKIDFLVLTEPNEKMFGLSEKIRANKKIKTSAEDLAIGYQFDTITCLWNVLGHVNSQELRIQALKNMSKHLNPNGKIFLDVNNRYNIRAYGFTNFLKNLTKDIFSPKKTNGDFNFDVRIDEKTIPAQGHVFNPNEIHNLIKRAGLNIEKKYIIDYKTGQKRNTNLEGQLLFQLNN